MSIKAALLEAEGFSRKVVAQINDAGADALQKYAEQIGLPTDPETAAMMQIIGTACARLQERGAPSIGLGALIAVQMEIARTVARGQRS